MAFIKCSGNLSKYRSGNGGYALKGNKTVTMGYHPTSFVYVYMGKEAYKSSIGWYTSSARASIIMNYNGTWKRQSVFTVSGYAGYGIQLPENTSTFTSFVYRWDSDTTSGEILWVAY